MQISVVVPVHNSGDDLRQCLHSLTTSTRLPDEIVVVDDASSEDISVVIEEFAAHNIRLLQSGETANTQPRGPAFARNQGAEAATGDIVWFLDADVCAHADALEMVAQTFAQQSDVAALFGSYDDTPRAQNLVSGYVNLRHHWTHQNAAREAWTFWSGCGAIRRDVFLEIGGFDQSYARPSVEDIALGRKLRLAGHRVLVCPQVQAKHLKRWTLFSWLRTDIRDRAIPWTRLMLQEKREVPRDLNLDWRSRASAIVAWMMVASIFSALFSSSKITPLVLCGAMVFALIILNAPMLQCFARQRGAVFAVGAFGCHATYFLYSSATFGVLAMNEKLRVLLACPRQRVLVLLLATLCKGVMWSMIVPPWQATDEPQHFLYAHEIARQQTVNIVTGEQVPRDAWQLEVLAPRQRAAAGLPFDFSDRARVAKTLRDIDSAQFRHQTVRDNQKLIAVPAFVSFHPPLYYAVLSRVLLPLENVSIRWRILAGRWLSVLFGVVTVAFAVLVAREIWPRREELHLLLGTLVAFQPMNSFTQAAITDDAPLIMLFTISLWLVLRVMRNGMTLKRGAMLGVVVAMGTLTKMSFLCVLPLLIALMLWRAWRERRVTSHRKLAKRGALSGVFGWLCVILLPTIFSGWWYQKTLGGGSSRLLQSSFGESQIYTGLGWEGELRRRTLEMPIIVEIAAYVRASISYWGNFGWGVDVRVPSAMWIFLVALSVVATFLTARALWRAFRRRSSTRCDQLSSANELLATRRQRRALCWLGAGTLMLLGFYAAVDLKNRLSTGGSFGLRGGYYLPAIAAQMAWLLVGTRILFGRFRFVRAHFAAFCGGAMILLNFACLFGVVARRYYGSVAPWSAIESATILQPVSLWFIAAICAATVVSSTLVIVTLGSPSSRIRLTT